MRIIRAVALAALLASMTGGCQPVPGPSAASQPSARSIWSHDNLVAWSVGPYDANKRGPQERAAMLQRLGLKRYAYYWIPSDTPFFEAEILAMKAHDVTLQGWWMPFAPDDPKLDSTLALFAKTNVHPDLWYFPPIPPFVEISKASGGAIPANFDELSMEQRVRLYPLLTRTLQEMQQRNWPKTPAEHRARVASEAARVGAIVAKAKRYGLRVDLYGHNQWTGIPDNQVDIIEALKAQGVNGVGIIYNFSHVHNPYRDDPRDFARIWKRIQPYVTQVNVAGTHMEDGTALLPGQGEDELAMMRVIQDSGWRGRVGVNAETGGDAEVTLTKAIAGLDGLAEKLRDKR